MLIISLARKEHLVKKPVFFAAIIIASIIISGCMEKVKIQSDAGVSITLSDNTVILCKGVTYLEASGTPDDYQKFVQIRCADNKELHLLIPAKKVVKIEILGVKKE